MQFYKYHGLGNDFIFLDNPDINDEDRFSAMAEQLCSRHFSVGADGLVVIRDNLDEEVPFEMLIFNPDGSEAEMCGNAIRCAAFHLWKKEQIDNPEDPLSIKTKAGVKEIKLKESEQNEDILIRVYMGRASWNPENICPEVDCEVVDRKFQFDGHKYNISCLSMGNPHCVIVLDDDKFDSFPVAKVGPVIENHSLFPYRTNVEFIRIVNRSELDMKVWERGAGETLACGTGACAAAVSAYRLGLIDNHVTVNLTGGKLYIDGMDENKIYMTGPAEYVFTGDTGWEN